MTLEWLAALVVFAFVSSATPGPNTLMLLASGANFGVRRSLPHMAGITLGFTAMVFAVGIGLRQVFVTFPVAHTAMTVLSVAYLLFLAYRIARAAPPRQGGDAGRPLTFVQAATFQWVNPKAWAIALAAMSIYAPVPTVAAVGSVALVFGAISVPSVALWTVMGRELRRVLTNPVRLRMFNWTMAALLVASLWPILLP